MADNRIPADGNALEATGWVAQAELPDGEKECLLRFIGRFKGLRYYRNSKPVIPAALFGYQPGTLRWVRFDQPAGRPQADAGSNNPWYHWLFAAEISPEYERVYLGDHPLLIVCATLETLASVLAMKIDAPGDSMVYEFDYRDLRSRDSDGLLNADKARVAFDSYAMLLDHVEAIRLESGVIILANSLSAPIDHRRSPPSSGTSGSRL